MRILLVCLFLSLHMHSLQSHIMSILHILTEDRYGTRVTEFKPLFTKILCGKVRGLILHSIVIILMTSWCFLSILNVHVGHLWSLLGEGVINSNEMFQNFNAYILQKHCLYLLRGKWIRSAAYTVHVILTAI